MNANNKVLVDQFVTAVVPLLDRTTIAEAIPALTMGTAKIVEMAEGKLTLEITDTNMLDFVFTLTRKGLDEKKAQAISDLGPDYAETITNQYDNIYEQAKEGINGLLINLESEAKEKGWSSKKRGLIALVLITSHKCGYDFAKLYNSIDKDKISTVWDAVCACPYMFLIQ